MYMYTGTYQNSNEAKNSNTLCISYGTKATKVTKNSNVLLLVLILLSLCGDIGVTVTCPLLLWSLKALANTNRVHAHS